MASTMSKRSIGSESNSRGRCVTFVEWRSTQSSSSTKMLDPGVDGKRFGQPSKFNAIFFRSRGTRSAMSVTV